MCAVDVYPFISVGTVCWTALALSFLELYPLEYSRRLSKLRMFVMYDACVAFCRQWKTVKEGMGQNVTGGH
jgi:hypothetical protein